MSCCSPFLPPFFFPIMWSSPPKHRFCLGRRRTKALQPLLCETGQERGKRSLNLGVHPPAPFTQAGKSRLEASEAHPADNGSSGWAEDVGFVENIQHGPLVKRLQVGPGEEEQVRLHPMWVPRSRAGEQLAAHTCAWPASAAAWRRSAGSTAPVS